jgi:hypothetical protein
MYIARWTFDTRFGKTDDSIALLRRWEIDVGERVGWKLGSVRLLRNVMGGTDTAIEFEAHCDSLDELERTWRDMEKAPYHQEYLRKLQELIVPGTSRWSVLRQQDLAPKD